MKIKKYNTDNKDKNSSFLPLIYNRNTNTIQNSPKMENTPNQFFDFKSFFHRRLLPTYKNNLLPKGKKLQNVIFDKSRIFQKENSATNIQISFTKRDEEENENINIDNKSNNLNKSNESSSIISQLNRIIENKKRLNSNLLTNNNDISTKNIGQTLGTSKSNTNIIGLKHNKIILRSPFQHTQIKSIGNVPLENEKEHSAEDKEYYLNKKIISHENNIKSISVRQYAYNEDKNYPKRKEMQDCHKIIDNFNFKINTMANSVNESQNINGFNNIKMQGYFTIFDGHGENVLNPIKYASERLPDILSKNLNFYSNKIEYSIHEIINISVDELDNELYSFPEAENSGSTMSLVYLYYDELLKNRVLYCCNLGDSKCILIDKYRRYIPLTVEHKCSNYEEKERILKTGGIIFNGRLFGQLALSRALGDYGMKQYGLISKPCFKRHVIQDSDVFVIMASDGIWDVLSEKDVIDICFGGNKDCFNGEEGFKNISCDNISKNIINNALKKGTDDNVSCIVILL